MELVELVESLKIHTEPILLSDVPLLLSLVKQLGVVEVVNEHVEEHGNHKGLSTGWLVGIWLVHILHTGSHAKSTVEEWTNKHKELLEQLTGEQIRKVDFEDNRLGRVLSRLSDRETWLSIERGLWTKVVNVYELPSMTSLEEGSSVSNNDTSHLEAHPIASVHIDSTASSGYHMDKEGLMQYGKSKDHRPDLRQFKLVGASIDGYLLSNQVLPGNEADNPHYLPMVGRVKQIVKKAGLLYGGDSKMADLLTRATLVNDKDYYLTRLPSTFGNAAFIKECISQGVQKELDLIFSATSEVIGGGYELSRDQSATLTLADGEEQEVSWKERVAVVRSINYANSQEKHLHRHIEKAIASIEKLTPEPGRGKRQITSQAQLDQRVGSICERHQLDPVLFEIVADKQVTIIEKNAKPGRAKKGEKRAKKQIEKVRFELKEVRINEQVLQQTIAGLGWIVYVTQVPKVVMNLSQTVSTYRENNSLENQFRRFKNPPINIRPIWVREDDQIEGLVNLLSIGLRLSKYAETIIQQALQQETEQEDRVLKGLYPELPTKTTATPTLKRCCALFSKAEVTRVNVFAGENQIKSELHYMNPLHWKILQLLNIPITVYTELRI